MKAPTPRQQQCQESLRQRAQRDSFLGTVDESPRLATLLTELQAVLKRDESDAGERLSAITRRLAQRAETLGGILQELRVPVEQALVTLRTDPAATALNTAIAELTRAGETLARQVRHRLLHMLDDAAPSHELVEQLLSAIQTSRQAGIDTLPDSLWLMQARRPEVTPYAGHSLTEQAVEPELEALCQSRWKARWRLRRLRRDLRRQFRLVEIDPQAIVNGTLLQRSEITQAPLVQRHHDTHTTLETQLNDAWRALRYNLDTAIVELEDLQETPEQERDAVVATKAAELSTLIGQALTKAESAMQDCAVIYASVFEGMLSGIAEDREHALAATHIAIAGAGQWPARLRFATSTLRKKWRRTALNILESGSSQLSLVQRLAQAAHRRGEDLRIRLYDKFGLGEMPEANALAIADLPESGELVKRLQALPPVYRRLYSSEPLHNREFLVGREDELQTLTQAFARWQAGRATNIAIIGNEGSGKSSLINCFKNEIAPDADIRHIDLNRRLQNEKEMVQLFTAELELTSAASSVAALALQLLEGPRCVIVVRRLHNMYLRRLGSSEAPRAFFQLMLTTRQHVLWITSFRYYPWLRLNYLFEAARYFTHSLETVVHDEQEMREAILRRQRTTGERLLFSDHQVNLRTVRKLRLTHELDSAPVQQALSDFYFTNLFRLSGGNIESAFYFWLLSLRVEQGGEIRVLPSPRFDDRLIRGLDRIDQFTLAELMGHGHLTVNEHAEIFRIDILQSQLVLDNLMQLRLVERLGSDQEGQPLRYGVSTVFQQAVTGVLTDLNILY